MIEQEQSNFLWQYIPAYERIFRGSSPQGFEICGSCEEVRLLFAVSAVKDRKKTVLYITETEENAKKLSHAAHRFLPGDQLGFYPARDLLPYESMAVNDSQNIERIRVLEGLSSEKPFLAVISKNTLARRVVPPAVWNDSFLLLKVGDIIEIRDFAAKLVDMGYVRETLTEERGTFSVRGSIVDVYPPSALHPYRIDFFDDEIESIRCFDAVFSSFLRIF